MCKEKKDMWNRKEIKKKGLEAFKKNYGKCLLAGIVLALFLGYASSAGGHSDHKHNDDLAKTNLHLYVDKDKLDTLDSDLTDGKSALEDKLDTLDSDLTDALDETITFVGSDNENEKDDEGNVSDLIVIFVGIIVVVAIILIICIFGCAFKALVGNPFIVGGNKFFYRNLNEDAELNLLLSGFNENYGKKVKTMFLKDLYTFLWSLLFIIPGIVKAYEYRMVPYLLAEKTELDAKQVLEKSKEIMTGNKWKVFIYDLSFIGWGILNIITLGLVGLFFLNPYKFSSNAALFEELTGNISLGDKEESFEIYSEI